jgi:hypothetical protein
MNRYRQPSSGLIHQTGGERTNKKGEISSSPSSGEHTVMHAQNHCAHDEKMNHCVWR